MRKRPPVYGLDIETDTRVDGLDPAIAAVVTVALAAHGSEELFTGPEAELLTALDERLGELEPGVIATWSGATFDLPFIAARADHHGLALGLRLRVDPSIVLPRSPLPGRPGPCRADWYDHRHLDACRAYRGPRGPALRISCSLRSIARFVGLAPLEADRAHTRDLSNEALHASAASGARLARVLVERRWTVASRCIDHLDDSEQPVGFATVRARHPALAASPA